MPSKKSKRRSLRSQFSFSDLVIPRNVRVNDYDSIVSRLHRKYRGKTPSDHANARLIFDPSISDIAQLEIGCFDRKVINLPLDMVPNSSKELEVFCRGLIDRGGDEVHIDMFCGSGCNRIQIDIHSDLLWSVRNISKDLYDDIVCGFHGRAIERYKQNKLFGLDLATFKSVLTNQALLWCAMDVQMVACSARVATKRPFGGFLSTNQKSIKAATIHRMVDSTLSTVEWILFTGYRSLGEKGRGNKKRFKKAPLLVKSLLYLLDRKIRKRAKYKRISRQFAKRILKRVDDNVIGARARFGGLKHRLTSMRSYNTSDGVGEYNNSFREFYSIWNSGLSPMTGLSVALIRYATAEERIEQMVDDAYGSDHTKFASSVRPFPTSAVLDRQSKLASRVRDLLFSARRVHLRDYNHLTRTSDNLADSRDPDDAAGWTAVKSAHEFLVGEGARRADAHDISQATNHQHTFWHLDVIPDRRLMREPQPQYTG